MDRVRMILVTLLCTVYCRDLVVRVLQYCVAYKDLHVAQLLLASPSTGMFLCDSMVLLLLILYPLSLLCFRSPTRACMPSFLPSVIGGGGGAPAAAHCGANAPAVQQRGMCTQGGDGYN